MGTSGGSGGVLKENKTASELWKIDNKQKQETHRFTGNDERIKEFAFEVRRLKQKGSGMETMEIKSFYGGKDYGTITARVATFEKDLMSLYDIGIYIDRPMLRELCKSILDNYYNLIPEEVGRVADGITAQDLQDIVGIVADYIVDNGIQSDSVDGTPCYIILNDDFKELLSDTEYSKSIASVKKALNDNGYTKCNRNRNDYAKKVGEEGKGGKAVKRFVCFYEGKVNAMRKKTGNTGNAKTAGNGTGDTGNGTE